MTDKKMRLGVSFEPSVELEQLPVAEAIPPGNYMAKSFGIMVEVIAQDAQTGRVTIEFDKRDSDEKVVDTISAELFNQLFYRLPALTLGKQTG